MDWDWQWTSTKTTTYLLTATTINSGSTTAWRGVETVFRLQSTSALQISLTNNNSRVRLISIRGIYFTSIIKIVLQLTFSDQLKEIKYKFSNLSTT